MSTESSFAISNRTAALERLHQMTDALSLFEFWGEEKGYERQATDRLRWRVAAEPHLWRFRDIEPCLRLAGELIPMEISERRSLIMINPALRPTIATVSTLFAAYRLNLRDEIAPAHRHTPNAIRLGLIGDTNFTAVDGEPITFGPGDVVLTPNDTWHNHGNGPDDGSINLSVLDMPLTNILNATLFEFDYAENDDGRKVPRDVQSASLPSDHSHRIYGAGGLRPAFANHHRGTGNCSPMFVYRWEHTSKLLDRLHDDDGTPFEGILVDLVDPLSGGPVYRSMTFAFQLLRPGERLLPVRQNANLICTVLRGRGSSVVGDQTFAWEPYDTFCIPGGTWYEHECAPSEDAILFLSTDAPTLRALAFTLKQGRTSSGEIVTLDSSNRSVR